MVGLGVQDKPCTPFQINLMKAIRGLGNGTIICGKQSHISLQYAVNFIIFDNLFKYRQSHFCAPVWTNDL